MTPERWTHVARVYELAADRDAATRDAFLSETCAGDEALRREVESLLRQETAIVVLDRPVWANAASLLDDGPDFAPGAALGPYRIEGPLGAGGMGVVFRGTDTRLNRPVAIKVLPADVPLDQRMRARFGREARAVAALAHPHICTLYDVGGHDQVDFLVMEYLEGETLAARLANGGLSFDQALTYAIEIASALHHAHCHGVIHRDLKPANIMLTAHGSKLLDFGLARFRPAANAGRQEADLTRDETIPRPAGNAALERRQGEDGQVTRDGTILGTVRYMAPEQLAGHEVDARSDLFSFGAVVFELLTGRRAFDGDKAASIRTAILEHEPPPVSSLQPLVPAAMDDIVRRCLAKNPDERWQTGGEVMRELEQVLEAIVQTRTQAPTVTAVAKAGRRGRWGAGILVAALTGFAAWVMTDGFARSSATLPSAHIGSVAVLPFHNLTGDPEQEYFADGMTVQLIADLATIGALRVISPTSVMHYRDAPKPLPTIASELQVDALIDSSVVRANDKVRITSKLIAGRTGDIIWERTFERDLRDVLALQREVAQAIISNVDIILPPQVQARLASARPVDPDGYRQILLGRLYAAKATEEGLRKAIQFFDVAISMDPASALAQAGLAEAYTGLAGIYVDPREVMPKAKVAAEMAVRLDESLADAHAALGYIHLVYEWDGPAAQKALLRALKLNPSLAPARLNYAAYLTTQARNDEAVREIGRAVNLDPLSIRTNVWGTSLLLFAGRYDEAIELARKGLEVEPKSAFALAFQGVAYAEQHRFTEAVDNLQKAAQLDNSLTILALQAHVLAVAGRKKQAETLILKVQEAAKHRYFCPYEIATVHVSLGDLDTAYDLFRKGTHERADCMAWLGVEPWIEPFRSDPRYASLLREIGLAPQTP